MLDAKVAFRKRGIVLFISDELVCFWVKVVAVGPEEISAVDLEGPLGELLMRNIDCLKPRESFSTYVHPSDELPRFHTRKVSIHTGTQLLIITRNRLVDLPNGFADSGRAQETTGKTGNVSPETELSIRIRTHEVKVLLDIGRKVAEHISGGETGRGERITRASGEVVDKIVPDLEHGWEALRKVLNHDLFVELFDGGVYDLSCSDCELWLAFNEAASLFESFQIARVNSNPVGAGLLLNP